MFCTQSIHCLSSVIVWVRVVFRKIVGGDYSGTSCKRPPLMSGLGGRLRQGVAYGKFH